MDVDTPLGLGRRARVRPYSTFKKKVGDTFTEMADYTMEHWEIDPTLKTNKGGQHAVATWLKMPALPSISGNYSSTTMFHGEIDALTQADFDSMKKLGATLSTDTNPCKRCAVILCLYNCYIAGEHLPAKPKLKVKIPADAAHFHAGYGGAYKIDGGQESALVIWVAKLAGMSEEEREAHRKAILDDFYALSGTT